MPWPHTFWISPHRDGSYSLAMRPLSVLSLLFVQTDKPRYTDTGFLFATTVFWEVSPPTHKGRWQLWQDSNPQVLLKQDTRPNRIQSHMVGMGLKLSSHPAGE